MAESISPEPAGNEGMLVKLDEPEEKEEKSEEKVESVKKAEPTAQTPVPSPPAQPPHTSLAELQRQIQAERNARAQREQQWQAHSRQLTQQRDQAIAFAQEAERRGVSTYELYADNQIQ